MSALAGKIAVISGGTLAMHVMGIPGHATYAATNGQNISPPTR